MMYALALIIFTTPQTIVTVGTDYTLDGCMAKAAKVHFDREIGKAVCVPANFNWRKDK
jgi:hypothetical protein|tara:strand:+ start:14621 stop:14794 length:174 start_codon:yes stop_codon:yes gene_type:complete